jgi:hypothetical protein
MANLSKVLLSILTTAATFLLITCLVQLASAVEPPADLCSLLPASVLSKTLGSNYSAPKESVAPRPFPNTAQGTDCSYESSHDRFLLRAYVDPSPAAAADLFARLKSFFGKGSTPVTGLGDEAYADVHRGLHVRKGKVRFFIAGSATDKQLKDLASGVVGEL